MDQSIELVANNFNLKNSYNFKRIKISKENESGISEVACDPISIQQVFLNLLTNAAQALIISEQINQNPKIIIRIHSKDDNTVQIEG